MHAILMATFQVILGYPVANFILNLLSFLTECAHSSYVSFEVADGLGCHMFGTAKLSQDTLPTFTNGHSEGL